MKKLLPLMVALCLLTACGSGSKDASANGVASVDSTNVSPDGIQRLQDYHFSDTVRVGSKVYQYTVHRAYSDSLPVVEDEEGNRYADNVYTLTIQQGEKPFFSRRFTKATFASWLSQDMKEHGILDGMMCDKSLPGLRFAVSVSLPQSDMLEPLLLQVDGNGHISISKDERGELSVGPEDGV